MVENNNLDSVSKLVWLDSGEIRPYDCFFSKPVEDKLLTFIGEGKVHSIDGRIRNGEYRGYFYIGKR